MGDEIRSVCAANHAESQRKRSGTSAATPWITTMPTSPFESIALTHLGTVTGGCGKRRPPPPPPQEAPAPEAGPSIQTNVQLIGYGQPATQTG